MEPKVKLQEKQVFLVFLAAGFPLLKVNFYLTEGLISDKIPFTTLYKENV